MTAAEDCTVSELPMDALFPVTDPLSDSPPAARELTVPPVTAIVFPDTLSAEMLSVIPDSTVVIVLPATALPTVVPDTMFNVFPLTVPVSSFPVTVPELDSAVTAA